MKTKEREDARRLRLDGKSVIEIARTVGVSKGSVSLWVRDISLTEEQKDVLAKRNPVFRGQFSGALVNKQKASEKRTEYQNDGRRRCFSEPEDYRLMCALYWAEGNKARNEIGMTNTDPNMLRLFVQFLRKYFRCRDEDFSVSVMAHLNNGFTSEEIQKYWLSFLDLPPSCLRKFTLKTKYYPDVNKKTNRRVYGGCSVRVCSSEILQTVYGSIQEIFSVDRPEWLS